MYHKLYIFLNLFVLFSSCQYNIPDKENNLFTTIYIQPFTGLSNDEVIYVRNELARVYPHVIIKGTISLPRSAYYYKRNRYRADSLIRFLDKITNAGQISIGLTDKDISTTKNGIADWGVIGLGYCPGKACVASTFRLSKAEREIQLFKVAIHELGHTEGLPHCPVKNCFMRDAEGRNPTNEENEFCPKCKQLLVKKGWKFN
jgi:archaemetzincin